MTTTTTMQIDPLALSRSESISTPVASKTPTTNASSSSKPTIKVPSSIPRIDFEPIYTDLKSAIGIQWPTYQDAITRFVQGGLNHNELNAILDPIFSPSDPALATKIESLHNQLICAILSNIGRDMPDPGVASWVSANDKPTTAPKPVSGDAAEQRVKTEVKNLPSRDRRRIKTAGGPEGLGVESLPGKPGVIDIAELQATRGMKVKKSYEEYAREKNIKLPDITPGSATGLTRTNWDLEIRKRYTQPLFSETAEFPSEPSTILSRIVPICYEESLPSGCGLPVAEFVSIATENFIKEFLSAVFARTRSNAPASGLGIGGMGSGINTGAGGLTGGVIMTGRYRKLLAKEDEAWKRGDIHRVRETGLLPIEAKEVAARKPISINDLKTAMEIGPGLLGHMPLVRNVIRDAWQEGEVEDWRKEREDEKEYELKKNSRHDGPHLNGQITALSTVADGHADPDAMEIDGVDDSTNQDQLPDDYGGWEGAAYSDRMNLDGVLSDILAAR